MYNDDNIITRIAAYKDSLGAAKIFVGLDNGTIEVYNGISLVKMNTITTELDEIKMIAYADANNNGIKELVISDDDNLLLLDYSSYKTLGKLFQGGNFAIGNVDGKSEIVL